MIRTRHLLIGLMIVLATLEAFANVQKPGNASQLKVKGDVLLQENRYSEALEYYTAALDKAKVDGDTHIYNACIGNISSIYVIMGDPKRGLYYMQQGYHNSEQAGDSTMMSNFAINLVGVYCMLGDAENARVFFRKQMQLATGDAVHDQYYAVYNQAEIAAVEGRLDQAIFYYQAALRIATEHNMDSKFAIAQVQAIGGIYLRQKQYDKAIEQFNEAVRRAREAGNDNRLGESYYKLARTYEMIGDSVSAAKYMAKYVAISDSLYDSNRFSTANDKLFEFENAQNQKQIDRLTTRNHTQLFIILIMLLVAGIVTWLYLALRRKNRSLQQAQRLLIRKNDELLKSDAQNRNLLQLYAQERESTPHDGESSEEKGKADNEPAQDDNRNDLGLTQEAINQLLRRITDVMEQVDVISDSDFGLAQLTQMVGSNVKYVSWVINEVYGKNFKTFLNEYRIKEACKRLRDHENYGNMTIQAIYQDVGFQSAASFINAFKKSMGMTPSTYQKLAREQQQEQTQE